MKIIETIIKCNHHGAWRQGPVVKSPHSLAQREHIAICIAYQLQPMVQEFSSYKKFRVPNMFVFECDSMVAKNKQPIASPPRRSQPARKARRSRRTNANASPRSSRVSPASAPN